MPTRLTPMPSVARRYRAGALSVAAAVAHGLATPEHLREWWGYGLFFALAAFGQASYGALLLVAPWRYDDTGGLLAGGWRHERALYLAGIVLNSALIVLYAVTRTVGIPFLGPEAGTVEPLTAAGLSTKLLETALVATLVGLRRSTGPQLLAGEAG